MLLPWTLLLFAGPCDGYTRLCDSDIVGVTICYDGFDLIISSDIFCLVRNYCYFVTSTLVNSYYCCIGTLFAVFCP